MAVAMSTDYQRIFYGTYIIGASLISYILWTSTTLPYFSRPGKVHKTWTFLYNGIKIGMTTQKPLLRHIYG